MQDNSTAYLDFDNEHFKKESTFYFTDKGAEFKKAEIKIIKIDDKNKESEMVSEQINLSTIISMHLRDEIIEMSRNGVEKMEIKCCCRPIGDQKEIEFVSGFINLEEKQNSMLQDAQNDSALFGSGLKTEKKEEDPL